MPNKCIDSPTMKCTTVIPTTFLETDVATQYNVTRAKNRALINVAVLNSENSAVTATISGDSSNLLGQKQELNFRKVQEGDAIYYLAELLHSDEDVQRLKIQVQLANSRQDQIHSIRKCTGRTDGCDLCQWQCR